MKHKNLVGITALCCASMLLFACNNNKGGKPKGPTMYTVTFYSEGEVYATQEVEEHELASKPTTDPTKAEHDFVGWFTAAEGGEEWVFSVNEVVADTDLFAHFELGRVDFTINLIVGDQVATTLTTNSVDQTDVTLSGVTVDEGKSLLGYGLAAGTTAADVDYRVGAALPYADVVRLANAQHVVNLYAIAKVGEVQRLNVAVWSKYIDQGGFERIIAAYKTYADTNSVDYDFLDWEMVEGSNVTNFVAAFRLDPTYNVVFPSINNFANSESVTDEVRHSTVGAIAWADETHAKETGRCITTFSSEAIVENFYAWILSDAGKLACDPDYEPPKPYPVEEADANKLVIGVWGRWLTSEHATSVLNAYKTYAQAQSITYTEAKIQYYDGPQSTDAYYNKGKYLEAIGGNPAIDVILPVTQSIADANTETADSDAKNYGITSKIVTTINLGTGDDGLGLNIEGKNDRAMATLNNDALTASFVAFINTDEGKLALDPDYGEQEVIQTQLKISYYGKFISSDHADDITEALEAYFTAQGLNFGEHIITDYANGTTYNSNSKYTAHFNELGYDISFGGKNDIGTSFSPAPVNTYTVGTIEGNTNRACYTFVNGNLANAVLTYLQSEAGIALLDTMRAAPQA